MNRIYANILKLSKKHKEDTSRAVDSRENAIFAIEALKATILTIETLIEKELQNDPKNTELLLRLAFVVQEVPIVDAEKSIKILDQILSYDSHNGIALILRVFFNYYHFGVIDKSLSNNLVSTKTEDAEINSMLRIAASLYYETENMTDDPEYETLLLESIDFCQDHVRNYQALAELYLKQGKYNEAEKLAKAALKNLVTSCYYNAKCPDPDITDYGRFLNEFVKGIYGLYSTKSLKTIYEEAAARRKLQTDPNNIKFLLDLANVELFDYSLNEEKTFASINKVLSYDPDNPTALILLAYRAILDKNFDESLIQKLTTIKTADPEINSMLLFSASKFYMNSDPKRREELLQQSIKEYPWHVYNYLDLAQLYTEQHKLVEAKDLKQQAFYNVAKVSTHDELYASFCDTQKLIDQDIKGIWLYEEKYQSLCEELCASHNNATLTE